MKRKISIIVPAFNSDKYIKQCINSILEQSYSCLEIIIVNDGSTDNTRGICQELAINDLRIKYFEIDNSGPAVARNYGLSKATGDYVGFVDADDYIDKNMYFKLNQCIEKSSVIVDIIMCGYYEVASRSFPENRKDILAKLPRNRILENDDIINHVIEKYYNGGIDGIGSLCNKLYRREFIIKNNLLIDDEFVRAEDHWFNFECYKKCESFIFFPEPLYFYIKDNVGSVMKTYRENQFDLFLFEREKLLNEYMYNFKINTASNNRRFLLDTIEYLYLVNDNESDPVKKIISIINNKDLINTAKESDNMTFHQNIIRLTIAFNIPLISVAFIRFFSFLIKIKKRNLFNKI